LIRMLKQETEREKKDSLHCFVKRVTNVWMKSEPSFCHKHQWVRARVVRKDRNHSLNNR
jgi:hypothetical protein